MKKNKFVLLPTTDEIFNENTIPLNEYPRMQFKRDSFLNLNGLWDYEISKSDEIVSSFNKTIMVPYPIESLLSNVIIDLPKNHFLHYQKTFTIPNDFLRDTTFLHFGAVDQICDVYLNDEYLGSHKGGYIPFSFNVTKYLKNINILKVIVSDKQNDQQEYAYGKQSTKRGGIWYTPITGIWQTVWLESVPKNYFSKIKITPDIDEKKVDFELSLVGNPSGNVFINLGNKETLKYHFSTPSFTIKLDNVHLWSPSDPFLYYFTIENGSDTVESYFAMRKFSLGEKNNIPCLCLNNEPYFYNGLLDQGYYSDGIYTPKNYQIYENEIKLMKELGFNTLRKHIKIEPLYWYYLCDKIGMIVWQDIVNSGIYNFLSDTATPTVGFKKRKDDKVPLNPTFEKELKETVDLLYNTPSIALWTIFNEGWGQHQSKYYYSTLKDLDKTRIIDHASGWFDQGISDVNSKHIYFKKVLLKAHFKKDKRPIILSEFGGYSYKIKDHSFNLKKTYGYRFYKKQEDFEKGFISLYEKEIIPLIDKGLSASIYTQVSDVEDETNGLLTYDRKVLKVDKIKINELMKKCQYK